MASVRMVYHWDTGDKLVCTVKVDASYPDALAEAKATCLALLRDGLGVADKAGDDE